MPMIMSYEDCDLRLIPLVQECQSFADNMFAKGQIGRQRNWSSLQSTKNNTYDVLKEIRGWLNTPDLSRPLILTIDTQIGARDRKQLLGISTVFSELLQAPGVRWHALAVLSEYLGVSEELSDSDTVERRELAVRIKTMITKIHEEKTIAYNHEIFYGATTSRRSILEFARWANTVADAEGQ